MVLGPDATCASCGEPLGGAEDRDNSAPGAEIGRWHEVCRPTWPDGQAVAPGQSCRIVVGPADIAGKVGTVVEVNNADVAVALEESRRVVTLGMPELQRARGGDHA